MKQQAETKAVLYIRVSTKDKGQNPERQAELLQEWCQRHGVEVLDQYRDIGVSATHTNPFERGAFQMARDRARRAGAVILVEKHDRFTRQGSHEYGWAITELKRDNVDLWVAAKGGPEDQAREVVGAITDAIESEQAAKWARDHGSRVASGMRTAKRAGKHIGRPRKCLSAKEVEKARDLQAQGMGVRAIATQINKDRGLYDRADVDHAIRKHGVKKSLVHAYLSGKREVEA